MKIPKCMSTQHPDNVNFPFFADSTELGGEDEIKEAHYIFSHLGCEEQMWDYEGKEVDNFVVKKLLTRYRSFFSEKKIGRDCFITLRVPNPRFEKTEAKILLETLESIPRSFDAAQLFYGEDIAPIFEVILPMTTSSESIDRIYKYYKDFVVGKQHKEIGGVKVREWIGRFMPEKINVIPLIEDKEYMLKADSIVKKYLDDKNVEYQRVFLARSDPALNYGLISATLINKIALQRLYKLSKEIGIKIYPIIGVGSSPFRGNLKPENVESALNEYAGVYTLTVQSAFKYDNPSENVKSAIQKIKNYNNEVPMQIDEKRTLKIIEKYSAEYRNKITELSQIVNKISKYIPSRRKRKPHVGLFGYSRGVNGTKLPRAIKFTASMYSIGFPPELIGINALNKNDIMFLKENYINLEKDLKDSLKFINTDSPFVPYEIKIKARELFGDFEIDKKHKEITSCILRKLLENGTENLQEHIVRAASLRKFLG